MSKSLWYALLIAGLLVGCSPSEKTQFGEVGSAQRPAQPASGAVRPREDARDSPLKLQSPAAPSATVSPSTAGLPAARLKERPDVEAKRAAVVSALAGAAIAAPELDALRAPSQPTDRENYAAIEENPVKRAAEQPVSTFSIDVDTGSYANVRRFLNSGRLPPRDAVRVEELINYFDYDYPLPDGRQPPFRVNTELAATPWNPKTLLLAVGIKGYDLPKTKLPPANLVFLIDVSGSMNAPDKLELLKPALKLLIRQLRPEDKVAIAVYAGAAGLVLEPTSGGQKAKIEAALDRLSAGGSTNGGAGIQLAYNLARDGFVQGGVNRVILATDGDFNVGTVNFEALKNLVETQRKSGIALTTLGFGTGNYNDRLMERLADAGNGNYAYIDTLQEANKVLVEQMSATLLTIAKDVKIQIEFNPGLVEEYRLIGYENRVLRREDFNNDAVDAGDIGAGHTVTALYEIALKGSGGGLTEPLRYAESAKPDSAARGEEIAFLRLRYKQPDSDASQLQEWPIRRDQAIQDGARTSDRFRFAAAVAGFGQLLRGGRHTSSFGYDEVLALAKDARGADPFGYRGEFLTLIGLARSLDPSKAAETAQAVR
ncbi:MAG: VWA domain-containing protein [Candidatus Competibacteraceae bacterium]|nr:VWA domain-containing protein [Candidatus Competibacteraceae bacterium]MBK9951872.1 VWA domain-containing protein [Candidatus Competibacteraceae bacterium]